MKEANSVIVRILRVHIKNNAEGKSPFAESDLFCGIFRCEIDWCTSKNGNRCSALHLLKCTCNHKLYSEEMDNRDGSVHSTQEYISVNQLAIILDPMIC